MEFTYQAYRNLLTLLKEQGYVFRGFLDYHDAPRCVILRHDIDNSLSQAVRMAEIEAEEDVHSTWFVLLRSDFYNPASKVGQEALRRLLSLGHDVGLHFDETACIPIPSKESLIESIVEDASLLSKILGKTVSSVSMHRPSKAALEADYQIPNIVNSYGETFFHHFKYLSDARCHWREPVEDIIRSGCYNRLQILTHAFWYHEKAQDIGQTVDHFICSAAKERYCQMAKNISDIDSILGNEYLLGINQTLRKTR